MDQEVSPKSIFFEFGRNTVEINGKESSFIEDVIFNTIDNNDAKSIQYFRNLEQNSDSYSFEDVVNMQVLLIKLLWRLPKYDSIFNNLFENAVRTCPDGTLYTFTNDEQKQIINKFERVQMPFRIIRERITKKVVDKFYTRICSNSSFQFLLGDYPIVYRHEPTGLDDLLFKEMVFPLSRTQLFTLLYKADYEFDTNKMIALNTLTIHQSLRFIGCSDKLFLEKSVEYYKNISKLNNINGYKEMIFK